ncbi:MAG TPA: hypothetical protein VIK91_24785 [Nannocystis sp.]
MATEEWIQESLARLESLEEEKKKHEAALESTDDPAQLQMHNQAIERLEVKIQALVAELEAIADQADQEEAEAEAEAEAAAAEEPARAAAPSPAPSPAPAAASPFASAPAPAAPFAAAPAQPSPFGDAPAASPFGASGDVGTSFPSASADSFDDSDSETGGGGSGTKIALILGLVAVLGVGGYFAFLRKPAEEPKPEAPPTEIRVIKAGEIPPDTQGPRAAKAGDIDSTQGSQIKKTEQQRGGGGGGGGGGGSSSSSSSSTPKKKTDDRTKIENTDDPLAGIR